MTIEIIMARGWRMWIDGKPAGAFEIGEDEVGGYSLKGIEPIRNIRFDRPDHDWTHEQKPTSALVGIHDPAFDVVIAHFFKATSVVYGDEFGLKTVALLNGEKHELDEITAYVRFEEIEQWWQKQGAGK